MTADILDMTLAEMKLSEYLSGMERATTVAELEAAIQAPHKHAYYGKTWTRISNVRIKKGFELVDAHPLGRFVSHFGEGRSRTLTVCDETFKVGRGGNSTGQRYVWHEAGEWAKRVLLQHGFSVRAVHQIWDGGWQKYPHRLIATVEEALSGGIPDPELNVMIECEQFSGNTPIRYTTKQNDADNGDRRATRPCSCGGTLFDWGGGSSEGFDFISWRCNGCPSVFTEYMTRAQFYALRNPPLAEKES